MMLMTMLLTTECMNAQTYKDHEYVDLGLPSGTLWATCNVGATTPEGYGDYFAWGETQPNKNCYDWTTYKYTNGSKSKLTKYCSSISRGNNRFTDTLTTLQPMDDAATVNWGSDWRMPTKEDWEELLANTTLTWTIHNGMNGLLFTASNGNTLFLPAAGYRDGSSLNYAGSSIYYWSSSLRTDYTERAFGFHFISADLLIMESKYRIEGRPVRAVREK